MYSQDWMKKIQPGIYEDITGLLEYHPHIIDSTSFLRLANEMLMCALLLLLVVINCPTLRSGLPSTDYSVSNMAYDRDELMDIGLCVKQQNIHIDPRVLHSIRKTGIARLSPTRRGCRGGAKLVIWAITSKPNRHAPLRGNGHNPSNIINIKCLPHHVEHRQSVNIGLVNCQSMKRDEIVDYIKDMQDIVALTETWLTGTDTDQAAIGDVTPPGYVFNHNPRSNRRGGGIAIITRSSLKVKTHAPYKTKSFENLQATVTCSGTSVRISVIYCLHPNKKKNNVTSNDFFVEFAAFIDSLACQNGHLLLLGDF